jgi:hypothetical protein
MFKYFIFICKLRVGQKKARKDADQSEPVQPKPEADNAFGAVGSAHGPEATEGG